MVTTTELIESCTDESTTTKRPESWKENIRSGVLEAKKRNQGRDTRSLVKALRSNHPDIPAVEIAELLSISRERVRQILKTEDLPTRIKSEPVYYGECKVCGGGLLIGRKTYCSVECRSIDCRVSFRCDYCGQTKEILQSIYEVQKRRGYKYMYGSVSCRNYGRWEALRLQPVNVS